ncbi:hypothetical protein RDI58_013096 [Solanum bulbocastanum]|uniref:Uncharacterized protein n=1 Tax=Solanum bulbocastanum TaxID=147425 RepID=A0AAN8YEA8_SOLBU
MNQILDTIIALMAGSDSEEEEEDKQDQDLLMEDYASLREDNMNLEQQNCLLQNELIELNKELDSINVKNKDLQKKLHMTKMEVEHSMRWNRSSILLDSIQKSQSTTKHGIGFHKAKGPNIHCLCSHCGTYRS